MNKVRNILVVTFVAMGILFLAIGTGVLYASGMFVKNLVEIQGKIVGFRGNNPVVSFEADGATYQLEGSLHASSQRRGDEYTLYIDPANPTKAYDSGMRIGGWVMGGTGLTILLAGVAVGFAMGNGARKREALLVYGRRVTGKVTAVKQNKAVSVNNRHPWLITATCTHPLTGETVILRSHQLWNEPSLKEGSHVDIVFDPMNEKKYAFDVRDGEVSG